MYEVKTQLFSELGPGIIGTFDAFDDAIGHALDKFTFGADTWIEEDGFVMITPKELELRFQTEHPLA